MMTASVYTKLLIVFLFVLTVITGFNFFRKPFGNSLNQPTTTQTPDLKPIDVSTLQADQLEDQIAKFSNEEKIWQLMTVPIVIENDFHQTDNVATFTAQLQFLSENKPGFVLLYGDQVTALSVKQVIEQIRQAYPSDYPSPVIMVDHEGGVVQRLSGDGFTNLPSWQQLCSLSQTQRAKYLDQSAQELAAVGVDLVLSPVVDVATKSTILKERVCSGDPELVAAAATDYIQIFSSHNLATVIKHYPGIGSMTKDIHFQFDHQTILKKDILPFDLILEKYPTLGVMTTHIGVNGKDETKPCSLSAACLLGLTETYPKVLVFSDDLAMKAAAYDNQSKTYSKTFDQISMQALEAGNQVLIFAQGVKLTELEIVAQSLSNSVLEDVDLSSRIDTAVKRILAFKKQQLTVQ